MNYNLFLDDIRYPQNVTYTKIPDVKWIIVRNFDDFVYTISTFGIPDNISFDHDLGIKSMEEFNKNGLNYDYNNIGEEKTGLHCALYLKEILNKKKYKWPNIFIHTINPVGLHNIKTVFNLS